MTSKQIQMAVLIQDLCLAFIINAIFVTIISFCIALINAGVSPQDVAFYFHGEACCTGYLAIEQAVNAVASGKYNCVLSGCVEFGDSLAVGSHPCKREKMTMEKFLQTTAWLYDRNYTRSFMAGQELIYDGAAAVIVCATDMVEKYMGNKSHKPIEVLGIGCAACEATTPHFEVRGLNKKKRMELLDKLPVPCHAVIYQRDGYKTVIFDLDEE